LFSFVIIRLFFLILYRPSFKKFSTLPERPKSNFYACRVLGFDDPYFVTGVEVICLEILLRSLALVELWGRGYIL
jgi:hypothetical protein